MSCTGNDQVCRLAYVCVDHPIDYFVSVQALKVESCPFCAHISLTTITEDPYSRDDRTNFSKWSVVKLVRLKDWTKFPYCQWCNVSRCLRKLAVCDYTHVDHILRPWAYHRGIECTAAFLLYTAIVSCTLHNTQHSRVGSRVSFPEAIPAIPDKHH